MGLFKKLRSKLHKKNRNDVYNPEWEAEEAEHQVDYDNQEQREDYVKSCLERMADATKELENLTYEYDMVTSYLKDMEEIEALPEEESAQLKECARRVAELQDSKAEFMERPRRISDEQYQMMERMADEVKDGYEKLTEAEEYQNLVRQDLGRLDGERHAYTYRRNEVMSLIADTRGMAVITVVALGLCVLLLLGLQFFLDMDTRVGYLLTAAAAATAITVIYIKHLDARQELRRVENGINKIILLQNKVKIRYENNRNLRDYLCMKYSTENAASLDRLWKKYQKEKEERREYAEAESKAEYYRKQLVHELARYRISSPERWLGHPAALLDKREMVEIRHDLILRRQSLRKQMDYNQDISETARREIMDVAEKYPEYAVEIQEMVDHYKAD